MTATWLSWLPEVALWQPGRLAGLPAIDLEITESLLMDDIAGNIEKLKALRDLGMIARALAFRGIERAVAQGRGSGCANLEGGVRIPG